MGDMEVHEKYDIHMRTSLFLFECDRAKCDKTK